MSLSDPVVLPSFLMVILIWMKSSQVWNPQGGCFLWTLCLLMSGLRLPPRQPYGASAGAIAAVTVPAATSSNGSTAAVAVPVAAAIVGAISVTTVAAAAVSVGATDVVTVPPRPSASASTPSLPHMSPLRQTALGTCLHQPFSIFV